MALGIDPAEHYPWRSVELRPGDVLLLYTDGVTEARNYRDEAFGRSRVVKSLSTHGAPDASAGMIAKQLLWDVRRFVGLAPQTDDITIVVVKVS